MTSAKDELTTLRLSADAFSDRDRVEAFREVFGHAILRIDIEPLQGSALRAEMLLRAFSGFGMASGSLSPMRNRHAPNLIDNDDLVLVAMQNGLGTLEQRGRRIEIGEGQVALTANGEPATFTGHTHTQVVNLRLSRALLARQVADLDRALRQPILADSAALRLLKSYANLLSDEREIATSQLRQAAAMHMHDLAALAIGATGEAAEIAAGRGMRAARLAAIKADIAANIGSSHLSIDLVATRQGITPRYVRKLFESEGTSFSDFVRGRRLSRAYRMLTDRRHLGRTISAIAYDCGFSDLSYFNRTFRRRYGSTPSDVRDPTKRGDPA
ncbi:MAG: AraC family transcriptional regulator [Pseudomonadota bacterium]